MEADRTQAITVSFVQTEEDIADSLLYMARHGAQRPFTLLSPVAMALVFAVPLWKAYGGWPGIGLAAVPIGAGLIMLAMNWYISPRAIAYRYTGFYASVAQLNGDTTVRLGPDGITWSAPTVEWVVPWGIVRRVDTAPSGICVTAGRPTSTLWLPARCFPTHDDLEMTGRLAARYAAAAAPVPADEVAWPQTKQQRKNVKNLALIWGGSLALVMLLVWWVTHTA